MAFHVRQANKIVSVLLEICNLKMEIGLSWNKELHGKSAIFKPGTVSYEHKPAVN